MFAVILTFLTCLFSDTVLAQDASFKFIEPPAVGLAGEYSTNKVYQLGAKMNIAWRCNYTSITITISQDDGLGSNSNFPIVENLLTMGGTSGSYLWDITMLPTLSLDRNPVFWLSISQNGKGYFNSHYFNITRQGLSPPTMTTMTIPATVTVTASNLPLVAKYNQAHRNEIGLGVGFGLLLLILAVGGTTAALYIRKLRRLRHEPEIRNTPDDEPVPQMPTSDFIHGGRDGDSVASYPSGQPFMRETMSTR